MKQFSRLFFILLAVVITLPTLQSCKKGEMDPALSLKSRKARMAGEYLLTGQSTTEKHTERFVNGNCVELTTETRTGTYSGDMFIEDITTVVSKTGGCSPKDTTYTVKDKDTSYFKIEVMFDKDGNFTWAETSNYDPKDPLAKTITTTEGVWNFGSGVGEVKNKEQLILQPTSTTTAVTDKTGKVTSTTTASVTPLAMIFNIKQLRSGEIILVSTTNSVSTDETTTDEATEEYVLTEKE